MNYEKPAERPEIGVFYGFDHVTLWVGNALQAASYYCTRLGFEYLAYKGLETGDREFATHAVSNGRVIFVFTSPLGSHSEEFDRHLAVHGDGVKDVAFTVDDTVGIYNKAVARGAKSVKEPETLYD
jgi:4-hydroxyphenylpyruvate dioxygenase